MAQMISRGREIIRIIKEGDIIDAVKSFAAKLKVLRKRVNLLSEGRQAFPGERVNLFRTGRQMLKKKA